MYVDASSGTASVTTSSSLALVSVSGGVHSIAAPVSCCSTPVMFDLRGNAAHATDAENVEGYALMLGTDRPLAGPTAGSLAGPILEATGATITANGGINIDAALLEATAPLIRLVNSIMTSNTDFITLANASRLNINVPSDAMISMNASTLNILNGSLVNVAGGSYLNVTGNLLNMSNGSLLNILNGLLLNVSNGSVATVSNSLVGFSGAGNVLTVNNTYMPTGYIFGIPVYSSLGGTTGFNILSNPISGAGTIKVNGTTITSTTNSGVTGSLVAITGTGGAVKVGH